MCQKEAPPTSCYKTHKYLIEFVLSLTKICKKVQYDIKCSILQGNESWNFVDLVIVDSVISIMVPADAHMLVWGQGLGLSPSSCNFLLKVLLSKLCCCP